MGKVKKRNGTLVPFENGRIVVAIEKAYYSCRSKIINEDILDDFYAIADEIESLISESEETLSIYTIEREVFHRLIDYKYPDVARAYEGYKAVQTHKRKNNTTDNSIESLMKLTSDAVSENSNKDARLIATQRDLIAGEISKDLVRRKILPAHIVQAHDDGAIHIHDMDYMLQPTFNCCIIDLKDMLENGTSINQKMVESPKSIQVACTVATQIISHVASNQQGLI